MPAALFFFTFLFVYGGMHAYAYRKVQLTFHLSPGPKMLLIIFMVFMVAAPMLIHMQNKRGMRLTALLTAYMGFTWMGFLLLFFTVFLAADVYNLLIRTAGVAFGLSQNLPDISKFALTGRNSFFLLTLLVVAIMCYSIFDAQRIRTERVPLAYSRLPAGVTHVTIVQISDVHLSLMVRRHFLKKVIAAVKKAKPDILVSTGDMVDMEVKQIMDMAELFQEINPPYGKFAIMGNHDFYAGINDAVAFAQRAGFKVLRGEGVTVAGMINIAGVDDPTGFYFSQTAPQNEKAILAALPHGLFTVLLKHRPDITDGSPGLFDLQLSGHTHGGQIFPFKWVIHFLYPMQDGLYQLSPRSFLYTSTGTGTWGPPMRFLVPPKVTVIEIRSKEQKEHKEHKWKLALLSKKSAMSLMNTIYCL